MTSPDEYEDFLQEINNLSSRQIKEFCQQNKRSNQLYQSADFWHNLIEFKFGFDIQPATAEDYDYLNFLALTLSTEIDSFNPEYRQDLQKTIDKFKAVDLRAFVDNKPLKYWYVKDAVQDEDSLKLYKAYTREGAFLKILQESPRMLSQISPDTIEKTLQDDFKKTPLDCIPVESYRVIEVDFQKIHDKNLLTIEGKATRDPDYYTMLQFSPLLQDLIRRFEEYEQFIGFFVKAKTLAGALHGFQQIAAELKNPQAKNFLSLLNTASPRNFESLIRKQRPEVYPEICRYEMVIIN